MSQTTNTSIKHIKRSLSILIFSTFTLPLPSHAVLPPFYQGAKEITAILNNEDVANKITSGRVLKKIERTEQGWRITANECSLDVLVTYSPNKNGMVGPVEFQVSAGNLVCENPEDTD